MLSVKLARVGSIAKGFGFAIGDCESSLGDCDVYGESGASGLSRVFFSFVENQL